MKVYCDKCGAHFPEDFKKSLRCGFWQQMGYPKGFSVKLRKEIWDWYFSGPFDKALVEADAIIDSSMHYRGKQVGNYWEKTLKPYKTWPEEKKKEFQKAYIKFTNEMTDRDLIYLKMDAFFTTHKDWGKYLIETGRAMRNEGS